jgi:creatinine amidohydrolase/Fe(II)-dependent formamide hydrolase-like protein
MRPLTLPDNNFLYLTSEDDVRNRVGFLPVGSLECHGGSLPLGTDLLIARAFATAFARQVEGVIFPEISYGYCPNTAALPGTVSPRADAFLPYLIEIYRQVHRLCERLIVVNIHRGNEAPIALVVDELFQSEGISIYYLNPYTFLGAAVDADMFPGRDNSYKEASLLLAALRLLGDLHADDYVARSDQNSDKPPEMTLLRKHGQLGFSYPSAEAHIAARKDVDIQAGLRFFEKAAEKTADLIAAWKKLEPSL